MRKLIVADVKVWIDCAYASSCFELYEVSIMVPTTMNNPDETNNENNDNVEVVEPENNDSAVGANNENNDNAQVVVMILVISEDQRQPLIVEDNGGP
ncbi:uncharacterized protein G2W53_041992 [Senna tora]|uniref:Uncharacterized protein n=1 Tax=Senna tora TaxID=362788 RepID=A0A834W1Y7_9FABA|nr:uncharacterized protein G2W53_041992 [Senna tora]